MERRKPLKAKTGLKRGTPLKTTKALKSKKGLTANKSLSPRSIKMKKIYIARRELRTQFLGKFPVCQAYWDDKCAIVSVDVHEILPRGVGGKIVDDDWSNFMAVCRYCHTMITDNPKEAQQRGLRKWSWEK